MLEKIRERVELEKLGYPPSAGYYRAIMKVLQIIDKYRESEDKDISSGNITKMVQDVAKIVN